MSSQTSRKNMKNGEENNTGMEFNLDDGQTDALPTFGNSNANLTSPTSQTSVPFVAAWWKNYRRDPKIDCDENGVFQFIKQRQTPPPDEIELSTSAESSSSSVYQLIISRNTLKLRLFELMKSINSSAVPHLEDIEKGRMNADNVEKIFSSSTNVEKNIAFLISALNGRLDLLKTLMEIKVDISFCEPTEGFTALHLSAFNDNVDCATYLINCGANVNCAPEKYTPLETACFHNSFRVAKLLLENGANIRSISDHGANIRSISDHGSKQHVYSSTPLRSAVKANAIECVQLILAESKSQEKPQDDEYYSPLHVAAEMGHLQCLKLLLDHGIDPNLITPDTKSTPLHLAAEGGFSECVSVLLSKGAKSEARNSKGQTALHLASRVLSLDCVEILLEEGRCNPNILDCDKRSALHSAVGKALNSSDITELLIQKGADVNQSDIYGYTPLHVAAINKNIACVEILIKKGANLILKTNGGNTALGIIIRRIPYVLPVFYKKLDDAITISDPEISSAKEVTMKLDFRIFLQHSQNQELDFLKTFLDEGQKEILEHPLCQAFLHIKWEKIRKYFIARFVLYLLLVVFLTAYIYVAFMSCGDKPHFCCLDDDLHHTIKGSLHKDGSFSNIVACNNENNCTDFIYVNKSLENNLKNCITLDGQSKLMFSIIKKSVNETAQESECGNKMVYLRENETSIQSFDDYFKCDEYYSTDRSGVWWILFIFAVVEAIRKTYVFVGCSTFKHHLLHINNIIEWLVLICIFVISRTYVGPNNWQKHVAAFTVLLAWINLLLLTGQTPLLGSYIAMYMKVQMQFLIIFIAYSCLLIGFTLSFCIVFQATETFKNPGIAFIQIIAYMIGALDYKGHVLLPGTTKIEVSGHIIFFLFMLFVTIIMWNLLVGIAVRDIQGLEKTAGISRLVRQTMLIRSIELSLFKTWLPKQILALFSYTALISPSGYRVVLQVKPLNQYEKRLPQDILKRAYEIARAECNKEQGPTVTFPFFGIKQNSSTDLHPQAANIGLHNLQHELLSNNIAISRLAKEIADLKMLRNCKLANEIEELKMMMRNFKK